MKYLVLMADEEGGWENATPEERQRVMDAHDAFHKAVADRKPPAGVRYYRAGATDMRSPDYRYIVRKRDTTFSDVWKN